MKGAAEENVRDIMTSHSRDKMGYRTVHGGAKSGVVVPKLLNASIGALIRSEIAPTRDRFWELYAALLTLIAKDRDKQGLKNLKPIPSPGSTKKSFKHRRARDGFCA